MIEFSDDEKAVLARMKSMLEKGHTHGAFARTATNIPCSIKSEDAASWCILGAAIACEPDVQKRNDLCSKLLLKAGTKNLSDWNDVHTQEEALELLTP